MATQNKRTSIDPADDNQTSQEEQPNPIQNTGFLIADSDNDDVSQKDPDFYNT